MRMMTEEPHCLLLLVENLVAVLLLSLLYSDSYGIHYLEMLSTTSR
jgi:hypothetical protein